jgi:hypothetical protein
MTMLAHRRTRCVHHTRKVPCRAPSAPARSGPRAASHPRLAHNAVPWGPQGAGPSLQLERLGACGAEQGFWDPSST